MCLNIVERFMYYTTCTFSEPGCPVLPVISNASVDHLNTSLGSIVTYKCKSGHLFEDHISPMKSIKCQDTLEWNDTIKECQRMLIYQLFHDGSHIIM